MNRKLATVGFGLVIVLILSVWSVAAFVPDGFVRSVQAQTDSVPADRTVLVQGQGTATAAAESVTVQFVIGNDQFSDTGPIPITEDNLRPVIDALIGIGVDASAISVVPMPGSYGPSNVMALQVIVSQPSTERVQQIVDTGSGAASAAGLSTYEVGGRFSVSDCGPLVAQAQLAAIENAQQQANTLAAALDVAVSDWVAVAVFPHYSEFSECQAFADPYGAMYFPPIDFTRPMEVRVTASIEVTYAAN